MATKTSKIKAEVEQIDVTFEFGGEEFIVPKVQSWPLDAMEAWEDRKLLAMVRHLFGEEQYSRIKNVCKTIPDLNDFLVAAMEAIGVDPKGS